MSGRFRHTALLAAALVLVSMPPAGAYLKLGARLGDRLVNLRWGAFPIRYFVTNRDVAGVTAPQLQQAAGRAFATWASVRDVSLSAEFVGFTSTGPSTGDGMNVIGFADRPELARVLGATSFTFDVVSGQIVEADIFLNSTFPWSVASNGESGRHDVESIALHEIGHLHALGHSALGETELTGGARRVIAAEAVMFPIAFPAGSLNRALRADDIAGISDIYGNDRFRGATGSIAGRVTKNGSGVLGAHVVAFDPASGAMVGGFSLSQDGSFVIAGLDPGSYVVRVEPLDDGDPGSFLDASLNIDLDFRAAFYERLVPVPRGGTSRSIEVRVQSK